ncbi:hypothetical protein TetV_485 [Tetraselmis virus 1]|uniref:Uncharacterized protein n=1 Tax=Tetraselmis virus 1 TaxID=2060617 RepID=A0A2P0VNT8_9VIRU|nr:hypothetical protein QJ968_gp569 [Tetraselmis virus 1]AUF82567.1 hypothetical protein TetV_485 [Tetraselmis virus 1]
MKLKKRKSLPSKNPIIKKGYPEIPLGHVLISKDHEDEFYMVEDDGSMNEECFIKLMYAIKNYDVQAYAKEIILVLDTSVPVAHDVRSFDSSIRFIAEISGSMSWDAIEYYNWCLTRGVNPIVEEVFEVSKEELDELEAKKNVRL